MLLPWHSMPACSWQARANKFEPLVSMQLGWQWQRRSRLATHLPPTHDHCFPQTHVCRPA